MHVCMSVCAYIIYMYVCMYAYLSIWNYKWLYQYKVILHLQQVFVLFIPVVNGVEWYTVFFWHKIIKIKIVIHAAFYIVIWPKIIDIRSICPTAVIDLFICTYVLHQYNTMQLWLTVIMHVLSYIILSDFKLISLLLFLYSILPGKKT